MSVLDLTGFHSLREKTSRGSGSSSSEQVAVAAGERGSVSLAIEETGRARCRISTKTL